MEKWSWEYKGTFNPFALLLLANVAAANNKKRLGKGLDVYLLQLSKLFLP
jgi:hypothetical protein